MLAVAGCGLYYEYPAPEANSLAGESGGINKVAEVVDGDTVIMSSGDRIRLLGINTPEAGMYFYTEAKEMLELLVLGKQVSLEKDVSDRDMYGRKLRYLYRDRLFINLEMVKRGFANTYTCPPDVRFTEEFLDAERYARENDLGLWKASEVGNIRIDLHYDAPGNDNQNINGEYAVMENTGDSVLDVRGWTVKDSGTNIYVFGAYDLHPGSSITLFSGKGTDGDGVFFWNSPHPIWNNNFDTLYLRDRQGFLVGIFNY